MLTSWQRAQSLMTASQDQPGSCLHANCVSTLVVCRQINVIKQNTPTSYVGIYGCSHAHIRCGGRKTQDSLLRRHPAPSKSVAPKQGCTVGVFAAIYNAIRCKESLLGEFSFPLKPTPSVGILLFNHILLCLHYSAACKSSTLPHGHLSVGETGLQLFLSVSSQRG